MNGIGDDELIPAKWSDTSDEGQDIQDAPQTELQVQMLMTEYFLLGRLLCEHNPCPSQS